MSDKKRVVWSKEESWRIVVDDVQKPDGSMVERGMMEHPGSICLVPLLADKVVMLDQYRPAVGGRILEVPAGTMEWGEDPLACAQRELREETGYRGETFVHLGAVWTAPGFTDEWMHIYLVTGLTPDPLPADFDEDIRLAPTPLQELAEQAKDGRLIDAKSALSIMRTVAHLAKN